ncbi:MAG: hypothetical protein J2P25_19085 [Nocardiopsaceae bacterium]|nr:hypothetical protein [Nocardiopsaceae bacterium]
MATSATMIAQARRYALRPVVVAASLDGLRGPADGLVELPQRLFWSGPGRAFDLADPDQALEMYEAVFNAARCEADLAEYVNGELLARLWPELELEPRVRRAWEAAHPLLALGGVVPDDASAAVEAEAPARAEAAAPAAA